MLKKKIRFTVNALRGSGSPSLDVKKKLNKVHRQCPERLRFTVTSTLEAKVQGRFRQCLEGSGSPSLSHLRPTLRFTVTDFEGLGQYIKRPAVFTVITELEKGRHIIIFESGRGRINTSKT